MSDSTAESKPPLEDDPVYRNSLREARFILGTWTACFLWTVTYCYLFGYVSHEPLPGSTGPAIGELVGPLTALNREPESVTFPLGLGIPDWVFYGVGLPWVVCIVLSFYFGLFVFREDDLSGEGDVEQAEPEEDA